MVAVVVFEFSGMRCQPLRRALYEIHRIVSMRKAKIEPSIFIHHNIFNGYGDDGADGYLIHLLLKGHLVVEAILVKNLLHAGYGEKVWQWSFPRKAKLCMEKGYVCNVTYQVCLDINNIRNDFCHSLGHKITFLEAYKMLEHWMNIGLDYGDDLMLDYEHLEENLGIEGVFYETFTYLISELGARSNDRGVGIDLY